MVISLHKNATTTPAIWRLIQTSNALMAQLAPDPGPDNLCRAPHCRSREV